ANISFFIMAILLLAGAPRRVTCRGRANHVRTTLLGSPTTPGYSATRMLLGSEFANGAADCAASPRNAWNRLSIAARLTPGTYQPAPAEPAVVGAPGVTALASGDAR